MKKYTLIILLLSTSIFAQPTTDNTPFKVGEWLRFELHYGALTAGYSSLEVKHDTVSDLFLVEGKGWTVGMFKWFFKVEDNYTTYLDKETLLPEYFIRDVSEGGYTINREIDFELDDDGGIEITLKEEE